MGIEPYMLRSGILGILAQRLVRKLCLCKEPITDDKHFLGLNVNAAARAVGCAACENTGYQGRLPLAELLTFQDRELSAAILSRRDADELDRLAQASGMTSIHSRAMMAVEGQLTSPAEVRRVLGFRD
jgi:general secretion pathway protein E